MFQSQKIVKRERENWILLSSVKIIVRKIPENLPIKYYNGEGEAIP